MSVEFQQFAPAHQLSWFVQYFWTLTGDAAAGEMHPIFPDGSPELVFNFGAIVRERLEHDDVVTFIDQPRSMLVGQMTRPVTIEPSGVLDMLGARLTPFGSAALLRVPASDCRAHTISLGALGASELDGLPERLLALTTASARIAILEEQLSRTMQCTVDALSHGGESHMRALARTLNSALPGAIDNWTRDLNCSARTLERHFDRYVGLSPKEFSRIRRFQSALGLATEHPTLRWSVIAARTGYADQSHLVRDFRQFAGAPPSVLRPTLTEISTTFVDDTAPR